MNIDKSNWKEYRFGDVVEQKKERDDLRVKDTRYIEGGHMNSEDLHLREWGVVDDSYLGPAFHRKFEKGDILYGSRRTYLKKVAVADFDGITANTTFVMRPIEDKIDPRLVPFLMLSESFTEHSVKNSKGSVNPYINWKDIAKYEFLLPPLAEQKKLANLLWAGDEVLQRYRELAGDLRKYMQIATDHYLIYGIQTTDNAQIRQSMCGNVRNDIEVKKLGECLRTNPQYGANSPSIPMIGKETPRYIRITDIDDNGKLLDQELVTIKDQDYSDYILEEDDFLFARTGNTVGKSYLYKESHGEAVFAGYLIRFKVNKDVLLPQYLEMFSHSSKFNEFKRKVIKVGAQPNINSREYQDMYIPVPSTDEQMSIVNEIKKIQQSIDSIDQILFSNGNLNKALVNQIFE